MTRFSRILAFLLVAAGLQQTLAQSNSADRYSISAQPVFWLDNLVPRELSALSVQFEAAVANSQGLAARVAWFRGPDMASSESNGYAISLEYRHYFTATNTGWHIGPFVEWGSYQYLGSLRDSYGSSTKSLFDFGAIAGHKWITDKLVFDISARTSWYSPSSHPKSGYFPRLPDSNLNSMMIVTVGYSLD